MPLFCTQLPDNVVPPLTKEYCSVFFDASILLQSPPKRIVPMAGLIASERLSPPSLLHEQTACQDNIPRKGDENEKTIDQSTHGELRRGGRNC